MLLPSGDLHRDWVRSPSGLILAEDAARLRYGPAKHPQGGDIFAGCGGASLGFKMAGIHVRFAVEWDVVAAITYMINLGTYPCTMHFQHADRRNAAERELQRYVREDKKAGLISLSVRSGSSGVMDRCDVPGTDHMWIWDVSELTGEMLLEPLGMAHGELDMLHGSPPCQGFSNAGKKNPLDPRNTLMLEYARLISEIRPKAFTMEQVPNVINMTTPDGQPMLDAFMDCIEAGGYASRQQLAKMLKMQGHDMAVLRRTRPKNDPARRPKAKKRAQSREIEAVG